MKQTHTVMSKKIRAEIAIDPEYQICALRDFPGHTCGGRITREHAIIYAGKKLQQKWAIIPLCAKAHAVDEFQDAGTMRKELNVWVAVNRATDAELLAISKAEDYRRKREYLNAKYGVWKKPQPKLNTAPDTPMSQGEKLKTISLWLIEKCIESNADSMTLTQEKVTRLGKDLGDWEITIKKK